MARKSTLVTLGILGAVAALGSACCCCNNWAEDPRDDPVADDQKADEQKGDNQQPGGHHHTGRRRPYGFIPIFFTGGSRYTPGPSHTTTAPGSPRGGFGATGSGHGDGGGA